MNKLMKSVSKSVATTAICLISGAIQAAPVLWTFEGNLATWNNMTLDQSIPVEYAFVVDINAPGSIIEAVPTGNEIQRSFSNVITATGMYLSVNDGITYYHSPTILGNRVLGADINLTNQNGIHLSYRDELEIRTTNDLPGQWRQISGAPVEVPWDVTLTLLDSTPTAWMNGQPPITEPIMFTGFDLPTTADFFNRAESALIEVNYISGVFRGNLTGLTMQPDTATQPDATTPPDTTTQPGTAAVPEPGTAALMLVGLGLIGLRFNRSWSELDNPPFWSPA